MRRWINVAMGLLVGAVLVAAPAPAAGQTSLDLDARGAELTRGELEELLERLEIAATSPGYSGSVRDLAAQEAEVVRTRLQEGDFQVGDRVYLQVRGEDQLPDTVAVEPGRVITLEGIGKIPLEGVLRSELTEHLTRELAVYLREPEVEASSLIRIAVLGQVGRQGFYTMPASLLVEEALMAAGGPTQGADLDNAEIVRGDRVIWQGDELKQAIIAGRTLDQLSLQAGDRIMVPSRRPGIFDQGIVRTLLMLPALGWAVFRIVRLF